MATVRNVTVRVGGDISQMRRAFQRAQREIGSFGSKINKVGNNFKSFGTDMAGKVSAPILGLGAAAIMTGAKFETSMSKVKAVTGATGYEMDSLEKKAREMGATTSKSASEAADAMYYMGLAGWDNKQIMEGIEPVLRLSEAGNIDLARASDLVTDSMSTLGLETKDLDKYLDSLAETSRRSNTDVDMLGEAMIGVGGIFKNLKTPISEASALVGVLANRGIKGSEAGTSLNSILINLTSGAGQAGEAMKEIGLNAFDAEGKFKGVSNVLKELRDKIENLTPKRKAEILSAIGGKTQIDTLNALLSSVEKGTGEFDELHKQIKNSDGALNEMVKVMQDNLIGQFNILKSSLEELALQFYDVLEPLIKRFVEVFQSLVSKFQSVPEPIKKIIAVIAIIAAILPIVIIAVGTFITAIGSIAGVVAGISIPIVAAVAAIGVFIAALIGIGVFLADLYKKNEDFRNAITKLVDAIIERFNQFKEFLIGVKDAFIKFYEDNKAVIDPFIQKIQELYTIWAEMLAAFISGDLEKFKEEFKKFVDKLIELFVTYIKDIDPLLTEFGNKINDKLKELVVNGAKYIGKFFLAMFVILDEKSRSLGEKIEEKVNGAIEKKLDQIKDIAKKAGKKTIEFLINGFNEMLPDLKKQVGFLTGIIGNFFPRSPAKEGALKDIPKWGEKMISQFTKSLIDNEPTLKKTIDNISKKSVLMPGGIDKKIISNFIKKDFEKIGKEINEGFKDKEINKSDVIKNFAEKTDNYFKKLNDGLKNKITSVKSDIKSYFDSYNLFSKVDQSFVSGGRLIQNLGSQVRAMKDFQKNMDELKRKSGTEKIVNKFSELGLTSLNELKAINRLTDENLSKYTKLFSEKYSLSEKMALDKIERERFEEKTLENLIINITGNKFNDEDEVDNLIEKIGRVLRYEAI